MLLTLKYLENKKCQKRFEIGEGEPFHSDDVQQQFRQHYFEVLDLAICFITDCFNQLGYVVYRNLECLLLNASNGCPYDEYLNEVGRYEIFIITFYPRAYIIK